MLTILPYQAKYATHFKNLNLAWIEEYFVVEQKDNELLKNCKASILDQGGYIFIGLWKNEPISCFAFLNQKSGVFELGKMAVNKSHQGLHIGHQMLEFAIDFAKNKNWTKIQLYSSTKLGPALHIYRKYGFKEIPLEQNTVYARSDIKMELTL